MLVWGLPRAPALRHTTVTTRAEVAQGDLRKAETPF